MFIEASSLACSSLTSSSHRGDREGLACSTGESLPLVLGDLWRRPCEVL